jgi:CubicO group peptidase (beta-lactamase class C family)
MKKTHIKIIAVVSILTFLAGNLAPLQATTPLRPLTNTTEESAPLLSPDAVFDQKISVLMKISGFPSLSACIIKDDQIIWSKGYGYYDVSEKKQATIDTIYVLASVTKTVVGTALMQLYEQGLCDLDDDVNAYLPFELRNPNFPDAPITFRMLLSHTSSLNTNTQMQYYWLNFSGDPPFHFFPEPYLQEFLLPGGAYYDPGVWSDTYRPGEHAMYANVGFDLISYLVELISGEPFLQYCDTHIFSPLDMENTGFNFSVFDMNQVAIPYQRYLGRYYKINELGFLFGEYTPPNQYWRMRFYPAGGLYSTVTDLSHFLIAHMNGGIYKSTRILKNETVALMHEIQPENNIGYGLAWMQTSISPSFSATGHGGDFYGVDTWMLYESSEDIGVIYLANGNPAFFGLLPFGGLFLYKMILYLLFTKEGPLRGEMQPVFKVSSDPCFLRSLMVPQLMLG